MRKSMHRSEGNHAICRSICYWLVLLCCLSGPARAQNFEKEGRYIPASISRGMRGMSAPLYNGPQPFHVLQYRLDLYASLATEDIGGTSEITLLLTAAADSIVLNAARLQLDSVQVDGATM